ncbi:MAG: FxsA family protein [Rhodospirillales bacterium]|nr:FxsA family protein [Rhodospirillales bacterium]
MAAVLFFAFVAVPIIEIALFIKVGGFIGFWPTIGIVLLTALIGTALLRHQGLATLMSAQKNLEEGRFPLDEVFDGLCLVVAGALLLTPGFFTDAVGFALFISPLRMVLRHVLGKFLTDRGHVEVHTHGFHETSVSENVIDGDFEEISPDTGAAPEDKKDRNKSGQ